MAKNDSSFDEFVDDLLVGGDDLDSVKTRLSEDAETRTPKGASHWSHALLCTTPTVPGCTTTKTKGLVTARIVTGQGIWKNLKMALGSDSFGKRSKTLEVDFQKMEQECFKQIKKAAHQKGANAVVGVTLQFGETSGEANLFYAMAMGTAVVVE